MSAVNQPADNGQAQLVVFPSDALRRDEPKARENPVVTALKLQALLDAGVYTKRSKLAAALGLSRARVTQLLNLLRLPNDIIDRLVALAEAPSPGVTIAERQLRGLVQRGARKEDLAELEQTVAALARRAAPPGGVPAPTTTEQRIPLRSGSGAPAEACCRSKPRNGSRTRSRDRARRWGATVPTTARRA